MIDTDELDRIYPPPADDPHKRRLTSKNLAAVWENLHAAGAPRLVLTMVAIHLEEELPFVLLTPPVSILRLSSCRLVGSSSWASMTVLMTALLLI